MYISALLTSEGFSVADKNSDGEILIDFILQEFLSGKIDFDEFLHTDQEYVKAMMQRFTTLDKDGNWNIFLNFAKFIRLSFKDI